jgi:hypothetical protein
MPEGFGWVDHRLVRENLIGSFGPESLALYLFLLTVGDENGVSWYSDVAIRKRLQGLHLTGSCLKPLRDELIAGELIAYRKPYYQILELPRPRLEDNFRRVLKSAIDSEACPGSGGRESDALSVSAIIDAIAGGVR